MKFFSKRKWTRNRLKSLRMHHLHPFFFEKFLGEVPPPSCKGIFPNAPTSPYRSEVGLQPPPTVDLVSRSIFDNAMYIFNAILLKTQLSLSELKRLYLHSRLHHFAPFFQNFLGGGEAPRTPTNGTGTPLPYPPHSALEKTHPGWLLDPPLRAPPPLRLLLQSSLSNERTV